MSSDFRQAAGGKKGDPSSSQPSSFQGARGEMTKRIKNEIEKELVPILKEKIESGIEKKVEEKGMNKILLARESKEDQVNKIKKEAARKVQKPSRREPMPYSPIKDGTERMHDSKLSDKGNKARKIEAIRKEGREEAQKETKKAMKDMQSKRGKMVLKLAGDHLDKVAYVIAEKLAKEANRGGIHAVFPILITYLIALGKDLLDYSGVGAIAGLITGILCALIIGIFWVKVSGGWKGGYIQKKLIKKIIVKVGLAAFIETLPGPNLIPTFIVVNLWSHLDWAKDIKKSKAREKDFHEEWKSQRRISNANIKNYTV